MTRALISGSFLLALAVVVAAQNKPVNGDWPMYSLNLAGTRYSPLTDINAGT